MQRYLLLKILVNLSLEGLVCEKSSKVSQKRTRYKKDVLLQTKKIAKNFK
ncbi:hypothetical protein BACI71_90094 [Bacillus mycoides]|uniref:Uncharacterized protein n=1 Tax=Bacillus mycoides TaxID=1405 RepID=A0A654C1J6_BACMY|nr:hypothetical protein BACI71_90094 [Bacillus mycoides]